MVVNSQFWRVKNPAARAGQRIKRIHKLAICVILFCFAYKIWINGAICEFSSHFVEILPAVLSY